MRRSLSILFVFVVLWLARSIPGQNPPTTPDAAKNPPLYAVQEAYELYSSILELQSESLQQIVVARDTEPHSLCVRPSDEPNISIRAAMVDYVRANQRSFELQPAFHVSKPYALISRQDLNRLIGESWQKFRLTYPNSGVQTFSAIGFNSNKSRFSWR
jgi:hypothetical protein